MAANGNFTRPDGKQCPGYFAWPEGSSDSPGVVVIQEWWGLNDQIEGVADRLAAAGYRALAPDLYRGELTLEAEEARHRMEGLDFMDAASQDVRGAVAALKQEGGRVGVMGYCMGGALSVLAAVYVPEADAVSAWYGLPPEEAIVVERIRAPVQGHFGYRDSIVPMRRVDDLERRLEARGRSCDFHRYDADHAFGNEQGANYQPEAARQAWQRTLDFFGEHLGRGQAV